MSGLNLAELPVGARVKLADGTIAEIVDNPRDGTWLICRFLVAAPDARTPADDSDHMIFAQDVVGLADGS